MGSYFSFQNILAMLLFLQTLISSKTDSNACTQQRVAFNIKLTKQLGKKGSLKIVIDKL